jgi:hypothetical protein
MQFKLLKTAFLAACSKAAMALIKEMFGLAVTLVPQGCMLPYEEDPVRTFHHSKLQPTYLMQALLHACLW